MTNLGRRTTTLAEVILLRTKLNRPPLTGDLVVRPRLFQKLNDALDRKLTLVSAPAGFGKSTFIASWLDSLDAAAPQAAVPKSAWLSLDEGDDNLVQFLSYVIAAAQTVFSDACRRTQALLEAPSLPPVDYIANTLLDEISGLEEEFVLVLDDYHVIHDPEIQGFVETVLARMPAHLHLVLITRRDPVLPLARLRVQQQLVEIRMAELCFRMEETTAFLQHAVGDRLSPEAIAQMDSRIEGWIAALRLASISMQETDDPETVARTLSGVHQHTMDYLVEQVLMYQPVDVRRFLLRTSILERMCAGLCDTVLGGYPAEHGGWNSREILDRLERSNIFVVPLDDERRWYRYHHLFRDLLHLHLQTESDAAEIAELHRRAAAWFAANGLVVEALRNWLAAGDTDAAASLVEDHAQALLNAEAMRTVWRWLDMLPAQVVASRPALLVARGWTLVFRARYRDLLPLLSLADTLSPQQAPETANAPEQSLRGHVDGLWCYYCYFVLDDPQRSAAYALHAVERIPPGDLHARGNAMIVLALALNRLGRRSEALVLLHQALDQAQHGEHATTARLLIGLSAIHLFAADLQRLVDTAEGFLALAQAQERHNSQAWAHYFLGCAHLLRNEVDLAAYHFNRAVELRYLSNAKAYHDSLQGLVLALQALGRSDEADRCVKQALKFATESLHTADVAESRAIQVRLALLRGEAAGDLPISDPAPALTWNGYLEMPALTHVRLLLARGSPADLAAADAYLPLVLEANRAAHDDRRVIEALVMGAMLDCRQGRKNAAREKVREALVLAQPGGYARCFVEAGPEMAVLLRQLLDEGTQSADAARVLGAFSSATQPIVRRPTVTRQGDELFEALTDREEDVLRLLVQRLSDKEIAQALVISPLTVRKHLSNIFQKLHVSNRRQAVMKARALGLLSPA